jgi:hypothetical protein
MPIDYSKYPPNWKSEIRPRIMDRADNTCEFEGCDFKHKEEVYSVKEKGKPVVWQREEPYYLDGVKKVKVILTIAHLDHDETNQDVKDDRLKAACQLCHLRYDAKEKSSRSKNRN